MSQHSLSQPWPYIFTFRGSLMPVREGSAIASWLSSNKTVVTKRLTLAAPSTASWNTQTCTSCDIPRGHTHSHSDTSTLLQAKWSYSQVATFRAFQLPCSNQTQKYTNKQPMHFDILWDILFTMFSQTCFGRYWCHFQGDVPTTSIQLWLIWSPSLYNN